MSLGSPVKGFSQDEKSISHMSFFWVPLYQHFPFTLNFHQSLIQLFELVWHGVCSHFPRSNAQKKERCPIMGILLMRDWLFWKALRGLCNRAKMLPKFWSGYRFHRALWDWVHTLIDHDWEVYTSGGDCYKQGWEHHGPILTDCCCCPGIKIVC